MSNLDIKLIKTSTVLFPRSKSKVPSDRVVDQNTKDATQDG